jgi:adenylosuccinate lyase
MRDIWEDENKYKNWLLVEKVALQAKASLGMIPEKIAFAISAKPKFTVARIEEIDAEIEHDMNAFIMAVQEQETDPEVIGEFHKGLTSYDVEEPAMVLQIKEAVSIIQEDIRDILEILKYQAETHRWTVMPFKTHGQIAELGTLGIKLLRWYDLLEKGSLSLKKAEEDISVCKFSGAAGTYSVLAPQIEEEVAKILGLKPARITSQILPRTLHLKVINALAEIASGIEQIALEIRLHSQSGIEELQEPFKKKQKGSSAMPHKKNPILCERLCGLAVVIRGYADMAKNIIATWDERDISHSGPERIIFPDAFILLDYILSKLAYVLDGLQVFPENIQENIDRTYGTLFSQQIKVFLIDQGVNPEVVYRLVQESSFKAMKEKRHISDVIQESLVFQDLNIDIENLRASCFDSRNQLKHIDEIFARFGL